MKKKKRIVDPAKQAVWFKNHYNNNKEYYYKRNLKRRLLLREKFIKLKESKPCTDCGNFYPACAMDFDHVRGKKKFCISINLQASKKRLEKEIAKCDLVCANCHRIRTFNRMQK